MGCEGCDLWSKDQKICYAGKLHERHGGKSLEFAPTFQQVTLFPGRMAKACRWSDLRGRRRWNKPWLDGLPRIICISDLSEALSKTVSFEFLETEIIDNVTSKLGLRHQWAWLTRKPQRMAEFSHWLKRHGKTWPDNLWAGVTISCPKDSTRDLKEVGTDRTIRFISLEPNRFGPGLSLSRRLSHLNWVIDGNMIGDDEPHGGPSDRIRQQCQEAEVPYFLNRLGRRIRRGEDGRRVLYEFQDPQGADWMEWPQYERVRQMPNLPEAAELRQVADESPGAASGMENKSNMYPGTEVWNPFVGCRFDCTYCEPSFKRQAKRRKQDCKACYGYVPHYHEERLQKTIPAAEIIFVCGHADISFCKPAFTRRIIDRIKQHSKRRSKKTFYFQSKKPSYFAPFLTEFPENVILVTTLETNRDAGYEDICKAPPPSERYRQFEALKYPRKVLTIEPVMDFDLDTFTRWVLDLRPEYVWLGFNSKPESVELPEPPADKVQKFMEKLVTAGIEVRGKTLRGLQIPKG
jgi:protein gp37